MRKYTVCTSENESAGQLRINRAAINQHLYLREMIHFREMIKSLYFLNTKCRSNWAQPGLCRTRLTCSMAHLLIISDNF